MFSDFKSQFRLCICCTFITGMIVGITASFIEFNQLIKETIVFGSISLTAIILTILFWTTIFRRLDLQDRINSIYTDID